MRIGRLVIFWTNPWAWKMGAQKLGLYKYHDCTGSCTKGCGAGLILPFVGIRLEVG